MYTRHFIDPDFWKTQTDVPFTIVKLSLAKLSTGGKGRIRIRITGWPLKLWIDIAPAGYVEIAALPDVKKGHAFDFRITCGINTFDIYFNDVKVHSFSDIHSDPAYEPLIITKVSFEEFGSTITDVHHTYCKLPFLN